MLSKSQVSTSSPLGHLYWAHLWEYCGLTKVIWNTATKITSNIWLTKYWIEFFWFWWAGYVILHYCPVRNLRAENTSQEPQNFVWDHDSHCRLHWSQCLVTHPLIQCLYLNHLLIHFLAHLLIQYHFQLKQICLSQVQRNPFFSFRSSIILSTCWVKNIDQALVYLYICFSWIFFTW